MKQPRLNDLVIDRKGTKRMRAEAAKVKKIKITINIDQDSLEALRGMAGKAGASYQKLLNQILKEGLSKRSDAESRLDRIERELELLKRKRAA
jgi:predicted DNA binding CopG/RHH family protein